MRIGIVKLKLEHLDRLMADTPNSSLTDQLRLAYFSDGSVAFCLLADGIPVFAGGIVNMQWNRGEAWMLPTKFFRSHLKTCLKKMRECLPEMASIGGFIRVQATCVEGVSPSILVHMGFRYEGTMKKFGPYGETCIMLSRIFDGEPVSA